MTLILAAIVEDAVIVAADTKVKRGSTLAGPFTYGNDEKLFVVRGCAVASFGFNNLETIPHFPTWMKTISGEAVAPEVLSSDLYQRLAGEQSLNARLLVGGIGSSGPELWEVNPHGVNDSIRRLPPRPGKEASVRGVCVATVEADGTDVQAILAWMKEKFTLIVAAPEYAESVGPPFQYIEVRALQPAIVRDL